MKLSQTQVGRANTSCSLDKQAGNIVTAMRAAAGILPSGKVRRPTPAPGMRVHGCAWDYADPPSAGLSSCRSWKPGEPARTHLRSCLDMLQARLLGTSCRWPRGRGQGVPCSGAGSCPCNLGPGTGPGLRLPPLQATRTTPASCSEEPRVR